MAHRTQDHTGSIGRSRRSAWLAAGLLVSGAWTSPGLVHAQESTQWLLHTAGVSHHFEQTRAPGHQWNEQHPGLGLERREADAADWNWRQSAGVMQDSRNVWGGYAGASLMKEWRVPGATSVGLGLGAFAFYRSVSWSGRRAWVPALLPTLSAGLLDDRLGVNLMLVPPMGADGDSRPALVYLQMTYRMR
ncbi:hypothetical protein [Sphaerotilus sp.]|uniref:hypothetical protein n=1 Tax=Sphaerotilus sp. TaxID=2093942 RepID=UPI0034E2825F